MVEVGNISIKLGIKSTIAKDVATADAALGKLRTAAKNTAKNFKELSKNLTLKVALPLSVAGGVAMKTAVNFDDAMKQVQAVTEATGEDFIKLTELARKLGEDTSFSASEAASAMLYLGRAGFKTNQILSAIPDTLNLARSTATDLGTTADIMSNIMQAFKIPAENAAYAVDILAKATNSSNTTLTQLGDAMSYVAPIAKQYRWSLEDTAAAAGFLSNVGIQASMAGTSLRGALASLASPTSSAQAALEKYGLTVADVDPLTHDFSEILGKMNRAGMDVTTTMEIFGLRAGPGAAALMAEGQTALEDYIVTLQSAGGYAAEAAGKMDEGIGGAIRRLKSSLESLQIEFGNIIADALTPSINGFRELTVAFTNLPQPIKKVIVMGGLLTVTSIAALAGVTALAAAGAALSATWTTAVVPILSAAVPVLTTFGIPLLAVGGLLAYVEKKTSFFSDSLVILWDATKKAGKFLQEYLAEKLEKVKETIDSALQGLADLFEFLEPLGGSLGDKVSEFLDNWHEKAEAIRNANKGATDSIKEETAAMQEQYDLAQAINSSDSGSIPAWAGKRASYEQILGVNASNDAGLHGWYGSAGQTTGGAGTGETSGTLSAVAPAAVTSSTGAQDRTGEILTEMKTLETGLSRMKEELKTAIKETPNQVHVTINNTVKSSGGGIGLKDLESATMKGVSSGLKGRGAPV